MKDMEYSYEYQDEEEMCEKLGYVLGEINMIHPFREGNGRTQRIFIEQLCKNNGYYEINFSVIHKEEMMQASIDSSVCNYESMTKLFNKCIIEKLPETGLRNY